MRFSNLSNHVRKKRFIIKIPNIKLLAIFAITCMLSIANAIAPSFAGTDGGGGGAGGGTGWVGGTGYWSLYYDDGWYDGNGNFQPNWGYDGASTQRWWEEVKKTVDIRGKDSFDVPHETKFRNSCATAMNNAKARSGSPHARVIAVGLQYFSYASIGQGAGYGLRTTNTFDQLLGGSHKNTAGWRDNAGWNNDVREKIYNRARGDLPGAKYAVVVIAVGSTEVPGYGSIKVNKTSADASITYGNNNYEYRNAVYGVYKDQGCTDLAYKLTLDANGNGTQNQVKPGTYYIREITAPKGYLRSQVIHPVTVKAGGTGTANVQETPKKGRIIVRKIDAVTTETVDKAGFTFELYDSTGKLKDTQVTTDDSNGTATFDNLPFGTYTVKETACPSPYLKNDEPVSVSCGETENEYTIINIEIADKLPYGSATIKKIDNVKGQLTPGTKFVVKATEDIDRIDGSIIYHKGDPIEYVTTSSKPGDEYGTATTTEPLYIGADGDGQYEFVEVSVPTGLVIDKTPIPFSFSWEGDTVEHLTKASVAQTNAVSYGSAKITKTDNVLSEGVPNVSYKIVPTKDIVLHNGTVIYKKGTTVETISTGDDGVAKSTARLYVSADGTGDYSFVETAVPGNMTIDSTPIPFTIEYEGQDVEVLPEQHREQTNNVTYGSAKITKKDTVESTLVPYAEYDVIATEDISLWNGHRIYKQNQIIEHVITGEDGVAKTRKPLYIGSDGDGRYQFVETAVRAPLVINTTPIPFTLTYKDNKTEYVGEQAVEQTNEVAYGSAQITKTDNVVSDLVPDTEYDVVADENINLWNGSLYRKGQTVDHVKTGTDGVARTTAPLYVGVTGSGRYKFIETKVPVPLTLDSTPVVFTIKYKNQNVKVLDKANTSHVNNDAYGSVSIKKTETLTNGPIQGAVFDIVATEDISLWNKSIYRNGQIIETITTGSDGVAKSTKPLYIGADSNGTYKLVEKNVPCPYYNDGKDVPFTINYKDRNTEIIGNVETSKTNTVAKAAVKLSKTNSDNGAPCLGGVYQLSPNENVKLPNGNTVKANGKTYSKDTVLATLTTGKDGTFTSDNILYIGASGKTSYKLVEIKAPAGYVIDRTPIVFTVSYENQKVEVVKTSVSTIREHPNENSVNKIVSKKADENAGIVSTSVQNAIFRLWNRNDEFHPLTLNDIKKGKSSYVIRIDGGNMSHDVTLYRIDETASASISSDDYRIILKNQTGDTYDVEGDEITEIPSGTYTITVRKTSEKDGKDIPFDGTKKMEIVNGKRAQFTIKSSNNRTVLMTDIVDVDGKEIKTSKNNSAYYTTELETSARYRVKIDGKTVYAFTTPETSTQKSPAEIYGRYDTKAKSYNYKRQGMLLKNDSQYIDKFTLNGRDYPVPTRIGTDGKLTIKGIVPGKYGYGEVDVPNLGDTASDSHKSYLVNTAVKYITVDETTGQINGENVLTNTIENDYTDVRFRKIDEDGNDVSGATMVLESIDGDVIDEWVTDGEAHYIPQLTPGTYYFIEKLTPAGYDQETRKKIEIIDDGEAQTFTMSDDKISVGAKIDKRQEIADPVAEGVSENGDGKNRANLTESEKGEYEYSVDYKNTANTWTDEYTVYDALDGVNDGLARLDAVMTPQASGDYDGKMNVWYQTNKTPADYADDKDKANATLDDGHDNPLNVGDNATEAMKNGDKDGDGRILDYTGWKLWEKDVPTDVAKTLEVSDLGLSADEYVTGLRFEYGRVNEGFATRPSLWTRDDLKHEHDDVDNVEYAHKDEFEADPITATKSTLSIIESSMKDIRKSTESDSDDNDDEGAKDDTDNDSASGDEASGDDTDSEQPDDTEQPDMSMYGASGDTAIRLKEAFDANDIDAVRNIAIEICSADVDELKDMLSSADEKDIDGIIATIDKSLQKISNICTDKELKDSLVKAFEKVSEKPTKENIDKAIEAIDGIFSAAATEIGTTSVHYAPAVMKMHVLDTYVPNANLINSVTVDAWRNGSQGGDADAGSENDGENGKPVNPGDGDDNNGKDDGSDGKKWNEVAGHDSDMVQQSPKFDDLANDLVNNDLLQTGMSISPYVLLAIIGIAGIAFINRRRKN